ncbi:hypothetical protein VNO77_00651 [Canavalia gladiata]|uniref:Uncharacterized protein n=1 Tax=Canavalia gladiata TaxID=3824 RepID=A0AAN9R9I3_CANGL
MLRNILVLCYLLFQILLSYLQLQPKSIFRLPELFVSRLQKLKSVTGELNLAGKLPYASRNLHIFQLELRISILSPSTGRKEKSLWCWREIVFELR